MFGDGSCRSKFIVFFGAMVDGVEIEFLDFLFSFIDFSWSLGEAFAYSLLGVQVRFQPEEKK